jgi:peptidoglycan/xylan/chitin deacetylase (PgdA/CDA1 family)
MSLDSSANLSGPPGARSWLQQRSAHYLAARSAALVRRYGITRTRAKDRVEAVVEAVDAFGYELTLPTPGRVIDSDPSFFRWLQSLGVELALHGYDHVDFRTLSQDHARRQLALAAAAYERNGIEYSGFRCPYLGFDDRLLEVLPPGVRYSSNKALWWDVPAVTRSRELTPVVAALKQFYAAGSADVAVSVPSTKRDIVEIPVSLPHDLLLHDRLHMGVEGARHVWLEILRETHRRGELFNLLFHPESFSLLKPAMEAVWKEAGRLSPHVWVTRMRDIEEWWREKASFSTEITPRSVSFRCSDRATILVRSLPGAGPTRGWSPPYDVLESRRLALTGPERPFVGIAPGTPQRVVDLLAEQGYILDTSPDYVRCGLVIDAAVAGLAATDVALLRHIESSDAPLVRYWRWPSEARSALCVSGDLDALTLVDYALRFVRLWNDGRKAARPGHAA